MVSHQEVSDELVNSLALIRSRFISGFVSRIENLDTLLAKIELGHDACNALAEAAQEMHRISGVAGTLGFPVLGDLARSAESSLRKATSDPQNGKLLERAIAAVDETVDVMSELVSV